MLFTCPKPGLEDEQIQTYTGNELLNMATNPQQFRGLLTFDTYQKKKETSSQVIDQVYFLLWLILKVGKIPLTLKLRGSLIRRNIIKNIGTRTCKKL